MPYRIKGTLKLPSGQPAAGIDIEFISRRNYSPLLMDLSSIIKTTSTGAYDITLEYGEYAVIVYWGCNQPSHIGKLFVFSDTATGLDLQTLLQQADWQPATPEYIQQIQDWLAQAGASASQAVNSAASAKASNDASKSEADRAKAEADKASQAVIDSAVPFPDVWIPFNDSLRMLAGYGRDVKVGDDVVARMVNFERSTTATYIDKSGVLRTAVINEPRFEKQGLLMEGQSTNLFLNSETGVTQTISTQAGKYTLSFFGVGTVTISGSGVATLVGGGVASRVSVTVDCSVGNALLTVSGAISKVQFEALPFASSYIPTNGAAVTRAADKCWIQYDNNLTPNARSSFTISAVVDAMSVSGSPASLIDALDITPNVGLFISSGGNYDNRVFDSIASIPMIHPQGATVRVGLAYDGKTGLVRIFSGGTIRSASVEIADKIRSGGSIGFMCRAGATSRNAYGHIRDVRIWHHALSDAQIKGLK